MKQLLAIIFSVFCLIGYGQRTRFKHVNYKKVYSYDYVKHDLDFEGCNEQDYVNEFVLLEIYGEAPDSPNEQKLERIKELDVIIENLIIYANCLETHTLIIQLGEALFLTEEDDLLYSKKGYALNAKRFWERYKAVFEKNLPGKTILLVDWFW